MEKMHFSNRKGMRLAATIAGDVRARPVLLLHGGGQTKGSWGPTVGTLAKAGYRAYAVDARGHGESDRSPDGDYSMTVMVEDLHDIVDQIGGVPLIVGASMGGIVALLGAGEDPRLASDGIVLVDVSPHVNPSGRDRVLSFMRSGLAGFDTLDAVADAVEAYNDYRRRPADVDGLRRNLREVDGRFFWHWDPRFLETWDFGWPDTETRVEAAARAVSAPILLLHAGRSDVVRDEEADKFRAMIPDAAYVRVNDAGHMVAGDQNETFTDAILDFFGRRVPAA